MGVTGEVGYSSQGRIPVRMSFEPFAAGDYRLQVLARSAEIKIAKQSGVPYVTVPFLALGSGKDGGKDRRVFHNFWLSLEPGKNGTPPVDGADQILGLSKGLGVDLNFGPEAVIKKTKKMDDGDSKTINILDPRAVLEWIQTYDMAEVPAHVKVRKGGKNPDTGEQYNDQNVIAYFIESEPPGKGNAFDDDEDMEDDDDMDEDDEEVEEEEEEEAPKKKAKAKKKNGKG